jgi:N-glycosidase YbiA
VTILRFEKEYRFLSNFWECDIMFEGILYPSAEHAYQAAKTTDVSLKKVIANLPSPARAKKMGQEIHLRAGWNRIKILYMRRIVEEKFYQNKDLYERLISTRPAKLIEGNTWGDRFWGESPLGNGRNELGKILMSVRDDVTRMFE